MRIPITKSRLSEMHGIRILNNTSHKQLEDAYSPIGAPWNRAREGPKSVRRGPLQNDVEQLLGSVDHVIGAGALELRTAAKAPRHAT